jgi:hypothetical protein
MARFGEQPELFSYPDITLKPFYYVHDHRQFSIGGFGYPVSDSDTYHQLLDSESVGVPATDVAEHPVALDIWAHPITTPRFYAWLRDHNMADYFAETKQVIADVFNETSETVTKVKPNKKSFSHIEIACGLMREGHVILQTIGNCACLGPKVDGNTVDQDEWATGYAEYETHNVDSSAQYISLMAGLGHLATRCLNAAE